MKYCSKCGIKISEDSLFCHKCGSSVVHIDMPTDNIELTPSPSNKITKHNSEEIPIPKLSTCFVLGLSSLLSIITFILAIQVSFFFGFVSLLLCVLVIGGTVYSISNYRLAKKDFQLYQQKKQAEKEKMHIEQERKQKEQKELARKRNEYSKKGIPTCPKCGSPSIATVNRGYTIIWGFIGSGKPINVCQNCGHKWEIGK